MKKFLGLEFGSTRIKACSSTKRTHRVLRGLHLEEQL